MLIKDGRLVYIVIYMKINYIISHHRVRIEVHNTIISPWMYSYYQHSSFIVIVINISTSAKVII